MAKKILLLMVAVFFMAGTVPATAPADVSAFGKAAKKKAAQTSEEQETAESAQAPGQPVVTHHSIRFNNKTLTYSATVGRLPVVDQSGKTRAHIFFIAYCREPAKTSAVRPVTFAFNGGPGAASVWLNFGAFGPRRVRLAQDGHPTPPPYTLADNAQTLLDVTDLVFIDPVGTGFSRPAKGVKADEFYGIDQDVQSIAGFIRAWVTRYQRWTAPKFLCGESYGGLRAVLLAEHLHNAYAMDCNGLVLLSPALHFASFVFGPQNDLAYALFLPTYAATASYHDKLAPPMTGDLSKRLAEVEAWSKSDYLLALTRGEALSESERGRITDKLAAYTGLARSYIREQHLRITNREFSRELLRSQRRVVGLLDSRLTAPSGSVQTFMDEPDIVLTIGPYTATLNHHMRQDLKYRSDLPYQVFSRQANSSWDWGSAIHGYPSATDTLAALIGRTGYLRVFIARGYYDLDIGYAASRYAVNQMVLPPDLRGNATLRYYESGHQIYVRQVSLQKLGADIHAFLKNAAARP